MNFIAATVEPDSEASLQIRLMLMGSTIAALMLLSPLLAVAGEVKLEHSALLLTVEVQKLDTFQDWKTRHPCTSYWLPCVL